MENLVHIIRYTFKTLKINCKNDTKKVYSCNNYIRKDAVKYANKHYENYNRNYPNFSDDPGEGGDCTNFISQCLYAGGMKWVEKSRYYDRAENWWCKKGATDRDGDSRITLTWKLATGFKNHWKTRSAKYSSNTVLSMKRQWSDWLDELKLGDVIQLANSSGSPYHTMIISGYASGDFKLAAHTKDTNSALFRGYVLKEKMNNEDRILVYQLD